MGSFAATAARLRVPLHFLLAAVLLWLAHPTPFWFVPGAATVAMGLQLRGWAAGHLRRESPLTVSGPYALLRHPLYLGSALVLGGFAVAANAVEVSLLAIAYFLVVFVPVMRREEKERQAAAPEAYAAYKAQVPAFWLRARPAQLEGTDSRFDWQLYWRNREWRAALGCALLLGALYAKMKWGV